MKRNTNQKSYCGGLLNKVPNVSVFFLVLQLEKKARIPANPSIGQPCACGVSKQNMLLNETSYRVPLFFKISYPTLKNLSQARDISLFNDQPQCRRLLFYLLRAVQSLKAIFNSKAIQCLHLSHVSRQTHRVLKLNMNQGVIPTWIVVL